MDTKQKLIYSSFTTFAIAFTIIGSVVYINVGKLMSNFLSIHRTFSLTMRDQISTDSKENQDRLQELYQHNLMSKGEKLLIKDSLIVGSLFADNSYSEIQKYLKDTFEHDEEIILTSFFTVRDNQARLWQYLSTQYPNAISLHNRYDSKLKSWIFSDSETKLPNIKDLSYDVISSSQQKRVSKGIFSFINQSGEQKKQKVYEFSTPIYDKEENIVDLKNRGEMIGYLRYVISLSKMEEHMNAEKIRLESALKKGADTEETLSIEARQQGTKSLNRSFYLLTSVAITLLIISYLLINFFVSHLTQKLFEANQKLKIEKEKVEEAHISLVKAQKELVASAHQTGMAEIATGVLHNIGNVLNSVSVDFNTVRRSFDNETKKETTISQMNNVFSDKEFSPVEFFSDERKSTGFIKLINMLDNSIQEEHSEMSPIFERVGDGLSVIKNILITQQTYAKISGYSEDISLRQILEDIISLKTNAVEMRKIKFITNFLDAPLINVSRTKIFNVIVNVITNAIDSFDTYSPVSKSIALNSGIYDDGHQYIQIIDNGIGITKEDQKNIFIHGFTTKDKGHGFGLHSCANTMHEIDSEIKVESEGARLGTCITLVFNANLSKNKRI